MTEYDAIVVGSGPNGLAAAIEMARAGCSVLVVEAKPTVGGGARTMEITLPGYLHDICSAIHPLGVGSPFFKTLPLEEFGLKWIQPELPLAHPFDDGSATRLEISLERTSQIFGVDGDAYCKLMKPFVENWDELAHDILGPLPIPPRNPILMARFGWYALRSTKMLVDRLFTRPQTKAIFAGIAAHAFLPLNHPATASFGMVLGMLAHRFGWPIPEGGSQKIIDSMVLYLESMGGKVMTDFDVQNVDELPSSKVVLFDVTPRQLLKIAGHKFTSRYNKALERYRYGPGVFKMDWALSDPVPWKAEECHHAGTVHLGGPIEAIMAAEQSAWDGKIPETPFVLYTQQSLFDKTRAPEGKHTGWAYCHVPSGSTVDMTEAIENQIERFAPGFKDCIIKRTTMHSEQVERYNANYIGGDINGGIQDLRQLFTRPMLRRVPYSTPAKNIFLCSSSTPPGGGVHGMCGYHAAKAALQNIK